MNKVLDEVSKSNNEFNEVKDPKKLCVHDLKQKLKIKQKRQFIKNIIILICYNYFFWSYIYFSLSEVSKSFLIISDIEISFLRFCLYRLNLFCPGYIISLTPLILGSFLIVLILSLILWL